MNDPSRAGTSHRVTGKIGCRASGVPVLSTAAGVDPVSLQMARTPFHRFTASSNRPLQKNIPSIYSRDAAEMIAECITKQPFPPRNGNIAIGFSPFRAFHDHRAHRTVPKHSDTIDIPRHEQY